MITYEEFYLKYKGKYVEVGGSANAINQCVDLANAYINEVCGEPMVFGTNAIDFPSRISSNFERIDNTPDGVPQRGDIMIYSSSDGIGHIDIFDNGNETKFIAFSQNWPLKSVCKLVEHTYTGTYKVICWLRLKKQEIMTDNPILKLIEENNITEGQVRQAIGWFNENYVPHLEQSNLYLKDEIKILKEQMLTFNSSLNDLNNKVNDLSSKLATNEEELLACQKSLKTANKEIDNKSKEIEELTTNLETITSDRNNYKKWYENKCNELKELDKMNAFQHIIYGFKLLIKK